MTISYRLAHRGGRSSQATSAAVDKSLSASHTKNLTPPVWVSSAKLCCVFADIAAYINGYTWFFSKQLMNKLIFFFYACCSISFSLRISGNSFSKSR